MRKEPNIFDYATGELSQDAFICWLLNWLDYTEEHELKNAAKEFILLLCKKNHPCADKITLESIGRLLLTGKGKVLRQYGKMDVFFAVEIDGNPTEFIIEDKTNTPPHSDQLKKYVDFVINKQKKIHGYVKNEIVKIYYKTGYLFDEDKNECAFVKGDDLVKTKYHFGIIDLNSIYKFLKRITTDNLIFTSYRDYISKLKYEHDDIISHLTEKKGYQKLTSAPFQYELMKYISKWCPETIGEMAISHGTSSGRPWTQYRFIFLKDFYDKKINESVFYRFEKRKNKSIGGYEYCLSIRQYAVIHKTGIPKKIERLGIYKKLFSEVESEISGLSFGKAVKDKSGSNSSEIAVLFFDEHQNNLHSLKGVLPIVHSKLLALINEHEQLIP
ncbi:hypothetical protein H4J51_03025 [Colwellia sp. MB02u-18]|uniref:PD-(D/E)XK nuclease family protein n=1 Tax=unclassified Colwellia TaxID=196834 RepID=UPI0015F6A433|nr:MULTISPECIES: PD-(D/E)XK nuclease family protein [unclassified Colwellia]MBA6224218.1 hypothetical protein [Colwellia sp. MB3u-45]MBA6268348.1 hypothetical protein [Colwellia sp. MB3u-43]MBA6322700.1 hypothetical protein [Colwellia sp. MB02u-19]MBA6323550.1 hypothetical protein [Colwellia sp. MB02u-18]MBA6332843.1 hypothetical protein [Colwellia sp. MB02u-12]